MAEGNIKIFLKLILCENVEENETSQRGVEMITNKQEIFK